MNAGRLVVVCTVLGTLALAGCGPKVDEDLGPIDDTLSFGDRINWPGVDRASGRVIPFIRGFGNSRPAGYWFLGFASRRTVDSFWFCREGTEDVCPLDANQRLNWDAIVGHPVFTRIPGDPDFSPFWQMWKVTVPADYEPDSVKTVDTLHELETDGRLMVEPLRVDFGTLDGVLVGNQMVVLHCALVLAGTTLEENGGPMPDESGNMVFLENRFGWTNGYRVEFVDFSPSDGVFPEAEDSENRPLMPFANIYIHWRPCVGDPLPEICTLPGYVYSDRRPVSERGLGQDITGDGDANDTNNVLGSLPCELTNVGEKRYSPLWRVQFTMVSPTSAISLIDTYGDQTMSDITSADALFDFVNLGACTMPEPQTEDETGNPVPGNDGEIFFNCPSPVAVGTVPYPCEP